eukprot:8584302-Heterocapsa_arctica.AAC.1
MEGWKGEQSREAGGEGYAVGWTDYGGQKQSDIENNKIIRSARKRAQAFGARVAQVSSPSSGPHSGGAIPTPRRHSHQPCGLVKWASSDR